MKKDTGEAELTPASLAVYAPDEWYLEYYIIIVQSGITKTNKLHMIQKRFLILSRGRAMKKIDAVKTDGWQINDDLSFL